MATIDQQATGADLQALAKRHFWMHFSRMGSYAAQDVPIIVRGEAVLRPVLTEAARRVGAA
jgi:hypothetical protein